MRNNEDSDEMRKKINFWAPKVIILDTFLVLH